MTALTTASAPISQPQATGRARVANVDVLRAVAALAVLAVHAYALGGRVVPIKAQHFYDVPLGFLSSGVWLFFGISGYVISRPFVDRLLDRRPLPAAGPYVLRRALRIYPLYWMVLTAIIAIDGSAGTRPWQFPLHYLLLNNLVPGQQESLFPIAWTLTLEVLFYLAVPALAYAVRARRPAITAERLAVWLLASWLLSVVFTIVADAQGDGEIGLWLRGLLPAMWQMFCPGILLAIAPHLRSSRTRRWLVQARPRRPLIALSAVLLAAAAVVSSAAPLRFGVVPYQLIVDASRPLFAVGFGLWIAVAIQARPWHGRVGWLLPLGLASYGIYLIHPAVADLLSKQGWSPLRHDTLIGFVVNTVCLAAITVPLALVSWRLLEQPSIRLARRLGAGWRASDWRPTVRGAVVAICALALVVRIVVVLASPNWAPQTDAADYDREAVSLAQTGSFPSSLVAPTGGPTAFRPPVFPVVLAGVYKLSGVASASDRWEAGRMAEAVLGTITVALICILALRLFGPATALVSGAIAAIYPPLLLVGSSLMSESVFIPLVLGATLCGLAARASPHRVWWAAACGVLIALAGLTRSVGLVIALPLLWIVWGDRLRPTRRALASAAALLAALLVVMVPWTVRNFHVFGSFVPVSTENGSALAGTYNSATAHRDDYPALWAPPVIQLKAVTDANPRLNEAQISSRLTSLGEDYIKAHPGYPLLVAFWSSVRMLNLPGPGLERYAATYEAYPKTLTLISVYSFWVVAILALIGLASRRWRGTGVAIWAVPGLLILLTVFFSGDTRYRSPADPFILMLAALGALALAQRLRAWRAARGQRLPSAAR